MNNAPFGFRFVDQRQCLCFSCLFYSTIGLLTYNYARILTIMDMSPYIFAFILVLSNFLFILTFITLQGGIREVCCLLLISKINFKYR